MKITQGVTSQIGGIGKGMVKQVVREPFEVLKDVGEQTVGVKVPSVEHVSQQPSSQQEVTSSLEQERLPRRLAGYRNELEELVAQERQKRQQKVQEANVVREKVKEQKQKVEATKKESRFQQTLKLVTGRARKKSELRLPKSA